MTSPVSSLVVSYDVFVQGFHYGDAAPLPSAAFHAVFGPHVDPPSRGYLMKGYLRRAAWRAKATKSQQWPFFDIAAPVNPTVRVDSAIVERVYRTATGARLRAC